MRKQLVICAIVASLALLSSDSIRAAQDGGKVPAARVVWQLVGKTLLNPATGAGQVLGYFTFLEGAA